MSVNAPTQNGTLATPASGNATGKPAAAPSEVGWLFVPQYYTFLNNDPSKLHCFYSKRSTLTHGEEQEDVPLCIGQQQIHEKIVSLGFSDAKVFVSNVDSQASAQGGIIIQVLGDISNKGGVWRKFAQTFFLAEQPNGYFVLNDIFRYLKDDDEDGNDNDGNVEAEQQNGDADGALPNALQDAAVRGSDAVHQARLRSDPIPSAIGSTAGASTAPVDAVAAAQANGDFKHQEPTPADPTQVGLDKKVTTVEQEVIPAAQTKGEEQAAEASAAHANPSAPTPALNGSSGGASAAQAPTPAPVPSGPKTWANLAASNATKWGSTVSAEVRGVSSARETQSSQPAAASRGGANASQPSFTQPGHGRSNHNAQVFIKNVVVENMPAEGLQAALEAKFGPMKECTIVAAKACAFGEFATAEAARKAVQASLPSMQGGEAGVKVGKNGWAVIIEEKRRPATSNAAGSSAGGAGRGGRGGGGGGGARGGSSSGRGGGAGRGGRGGAAAA